MRPPRDGEETGLEAAVWLVLLGVVLAIALAVLVFVLM